MHGLLVRGKHHLTLSARAPDDHVRPPLARWATWGLLGPPDAVYRPSHMTRPCLHHGCPELTARTRCLVHEREHQRARGSSAQRGYGWRYQHARRALLATATLCTWCGYPPRPGDPLTADHLVPLAHGGGIEGNLVAAHASCNAARGGRTRRAIEP